DAEKVAHLTYPTPARRDALFPDQRSRIAQTLNGEKGFLGGRKHCRGFFVRQDPSQGRTTHTKCGLHLLGSSVAAALLGRRRVFGRRGCLARLWVGEIPARVGRVRRLAFLSILQ